MHSKFEVIENVFHSQEYKKPNLLDKVLKLQNAVERIHHLVKLENIVICKMLKNKENSPVCHK